MILGIKDLKKGKTKKDTDYYSMDCYIDGKKTSGKIWDITSELKDGDIIECQVKEDEYNGKKQFVITEYKTASTVIHDVSKIFGIKMVDSKAIFRHIMFCVSEIENENYKLVTESLMKQHEEEFKIAPAAKGVHQAFKGGLIDHTNNVLTLCKSMEYLYRINKDLLHSSAILHDIGKLQTYTQKGFTIDVTFNGQLLDHLYLGAQMVSQKFQELVGPDTEEESLLIHSILSHHGKREWGSTVPPKTKEATILHLSDYIDSRMAILEESLMSSDPQREFTDKIFFLENVQFLNNNFKKD